jgi:hypothetical protein
MTRKPSYIGLEPVAFDSQHLLNSPHKASPSSSNTSSGLLFNVARTAGCWKFHGAMNASYSIQDEDLRISRPPQSRSNIRPSNQETAAVIWARDVVHARLLNLQSASFGFYLSNNRGTLRLKMVVNLSITTFCKWFLLVPSRYSEILKATEGTLTVLKMDVSRRRIDVYVPIEIPGYLQVLLLSPLTARNSICFG